MIYAPIVIPTLNRAVHLKRCVDSLAKCAEAKDTELYISVDYPPSDKYLEGYEKVIEYLDNGIQGFKNVIIIKQKENLGALKNTWFLRDFVYEQYDRCIFTEDDNEFASCFLRFMNEALERYLNNQDIFAVYGAKPSVKNIESVGNNAFLTTYFSAYGTGFWRDKEREIKRIVNRDYIEDLCCTPHKLEKINKIFPNAITFLCSTLLRKEQVYRSADGTVPLIDTVKMIYSVVENKYLVCSPIALVKNWGYDGSGLNCDRQKNAAISLVSLENAENNSIGFADKITVLELDYPLKKDRIIPFISAWVRILVWRLIAKRKTLR